MTLLESNRARVAVAVSAALVCAASLFLLWSGYHSRVLAAKRAPAAGDARASSQLSSATAAPVIVELFTSEGCSSCPPADALLAQLDHDQPVPGADIIALEEHVDYWDQLGWRDRFSSHDITLRQQTYASHFRLDDIYTPQTVVNGTAQFNGTDSRAILASISQASHLPRIDLQLSTPALAPDGIHISASSASSSSIPRADVYAALIETTASTQVARGENGGRTLHHVSAVCAMRKIGTSNQLASSLLFSFPIPKDAPPADLRVVVFLQQPSQGAVLGAAESSAPQTN